MLVCLLCPIYDPEKNKHFSKVNKKLLAKNLEQDLQHLLTRRKIEFNVTSFPLLAIHSEKFYEF